MGTYLAPILTFGLILITSFNSPSNSASPTEATKEIDSNKQDLTELNKSIDDWKQTCITKLKEYGKE